MCGNADRLDYIKAFNRLDIVAYDRDNHTESYQIRRSLLPLFVQGIQYNYIHDYYELTPVIGTRKFKVPDKYTDFISACMKLDELICLDGKIKTKPVLHKDKTLRKYPELTGKEIEFIIKWRGVLDMAELASMLDKSMSLVGDILQKVHAPLHTSPQNHTMILWDVRDKYDGKEELTVKSTVDEFLDL